MPAVVLPNEARTVENAMLEWLQSPELGWRYEDAKAVAREYRARRADGSVDEREILLLPILKEQLIALNPGIITDDERADRGRLPVIAGLQRTHHAAPRRHRSG